MAKAAQWRRERAPKTPPISRPIRLPLLPLIRRRLLAPPPVPERFAAYPFGPALRPSQLRASAAEAWISPRCRALATCFTA